MNSLVLNQVDAIINIYTRADKYLEALNKIEQILNNSLPNTNSKILNIIKEVKTIG